MKIFKKFNIRKVCLSLSIPTMMLLLLYVMDITDFSTEGEVKLLKYAHMLETAIRPEEQAVPDDVLFINISYDKELVPVYDEYGMPMGNIDVTDREKLWKLLCAAERNGSYKYILLDIFFEKGYRTEYDSLLFDKIASMPRIIIPKHRDGELADSILTAKAAYADYRSDIEESGFIKYPLFIRNEPTLATAMYETCSGHEMKIRRLYATDDKKLIHKSLFPTLELSGIPAYGDDGQKNIYNLSEDLLSLDEFGMLERMIDGKYLIIGSFYEQDIHDTFRGDVPGALIHFNVFRSLMEGKHVYHFYSILFFWFVFFLMGLNCITGKNLFNPRNKFLTILLSWLNYSIILAAICIVSYFCFHTAFDILIVATLFELIKQLQSHATGTFGLRRASRDKKNTSQD